MEKDIGPIISEIDDLIGIGKNLLSNTANAHTLMKAIQNRDDERMEAVFDHMSSYNSWYTSATRIVEDIIPHRAEEFRHMYRNDLPVVDHRMGHFNMRNYSISDYLQGNIPKPPAERFGLLERKDCISTYLYNMYAQLSILTSARNYLLRRTPDIKGILLLEVLKEIISSADLEKEKGRKDISFNFLLTITRTAACHVLSRDGIEFDPDAETRELVKVLKKDVNINQDIVGRIRSMESIRSRTMKREITDEEMDLAFEGIEVILGMI